MIEISSGQDKNSSWKRTHYAGSLRREHAGTRVTLLGWVQRQRDMGSLVFLDLRDREGAVQVVFSSDRPDLQAEAKKARMENVVVVRGAVRLRGEKSVNTSLPTGEVEVEAEEFAVLNASRVPPFVVADPPQASEELRFKHRYLDLRRPRMQRNIRLRHEAALRVRNHLAGEGFLEVETPFLGKSTPEGARDYLVPSRVYKGRFYALPQSPQLYKQLLMISGFDRYFQMARCFRDEDLRADRQPEFTQIDIEMSFVDREDVYSQVEGLMKALFEVVGEKIKASFPRLTYAESMEKYGTDKPDLRIPLEIRDLTAAGRGLASEVVKRSLEAGGALKGLVLPGGGALSRGRLDKLDQKARELGAPGLAWIKKSEGFKSSLKLSDADAASVWAALGAGDTDLGLLIAGPAEKALRALGEIRREAVPVQDLKKEGFRFCWVTDFPLFEWSEEEGRLVSMHHPFTSPHEDDLGFLEAEPARVRAKAYDLVLNGVEAGGGSIRIHDPDLQQRVFDVLGLSRAEAEEKFGYFLEALAYGTPPHGGIALGFDRLVMILAGEESIREVIPFPKTTSALCLLSGSPSPVSARQLDELGLKLK
ncbi:MAG: aspartate--tRNA ligase [Candidatus Aminicenantes bacterium]|nr:aspartate--tRNA ligase [Candidatus Aminicenantes bacterium]